MRYKRIPHQSILATREVFAEHILPRVGWPVIPVLLGPNATTLQDTSDMVDALELAYPQVPTLPADAAGRFLVYLMELLFDEWVKVPALHYRWNHDNDFAISEFGRNNDPTLPAERQLAIGAKIATRFRGWLGALGVNEIAAPSRPNSWGSTRGGTSHGAGRPSSRRTASRAAADASTIPSSRHRSTSRLASSRGTTTRNDPGPSHKRPSANTNRNRQNSPSHNFSPNHSFNFSPSHNFSSNYYYNFNSSPSQNFNSISSFKSSPSQNFSSK
jgi:hypothetical protein